MNGIIFDKYHHKVSNQEINCPNMTKLKSNNPLHCNIYYNMKEKYEYNTENLQHLIQFRHHSNQYKDKPVCKYKDECKAYIRCEHGQDQNKINDQCHMYIYRMDRNVYKNQINFSESCD